MDVNLFKAFEEEAITSALALEGFKFVWLLEKQVPDPTLYADGDEKDMTTHVTSNLSRRKRTKSKIKK